MSSIGYATYLGKKAIVAGWNGVKAAGKSAWNLGTICYKKPQFGIQTACVAAGLFGAYKLAQSGADWNLDPRKITITNGKNLAVATALAVGSLAVFFHDLSDFRCALQGKYYHWHLAVHPTIQGCL